MTKEERFEIDRIIQLRKTIDNICDNAILDKFAKTPRVRSKEIIDSISYQLEEFERLTNL